MSHKPGILFYFLCCIINQPNNSLRSHKMTKTHTYVCWKGPCCEHYTNVRVRSSTDFQMVSTLMHTYYVKYIHSLDIKMVLLLMHIDYLFPPNSLSSYLQKMLIWTNRTSLSIFVWVPNNKYLPTYLLK